MLAIPAAAFLLAGCGALYTVTDPNPAEPRYYELAIRGLDGLAAVPVQVSDTTATTTGAEVDGQNVPGDGLALASLAIVPGRPNAVAVEWSNGCEERIDIAVEHGANDRRTLTLKLLIQPECDPPGIPRGIVIVFEDTVNPNDFNLDVVQ
jgi:hypothetical protein